MDQDTAQGPAGRQRKRPRLTIGHTTLWFVALALALSACGGAQSTGHYKSTISKQEACCQGLASPDEQQRCVSEIVRVEEVVTDGQTNASDVAASQVNQATFRCMDRHFVCDAQTGRATADARQAQLDCINDIGS